MCVPCLGPTARPQMQTKLNPSLLANRAQRFLSTAHLSLSLSAKMCPSLRSPASFNAAQAIVRVHLNGSPLRSENKTAFWKFWMRFRYARDVTRDVSL